MRLFQIFYASALFRIFSSETLYRTTSPANPSVTSVQSFLLQRNQQSPFSANAVIRKRLSCLENFFNFTIEFEKPFFGIIYAEGSTDRRCIYAEGWANPKTQYQFLIPTDNCGSITTRNGSLFQISNSFLVQRDPKLIESNDNVFTVVCQRFSPTHKDPEESTFGAITMIYERFEVIGPTEEIITRSVNEVIAKDVQFGTRLAMGDDPDGPLPEKPVQLGERMTYVFYCATNGSEKNLQSKDCTIGECVATDPSGTKRVQLSDHNGCSKHPAVWSNFFNHDSQLRSGIQAKKILLARLSAWSFPTSAHVLISCKARSCDGPCSGGPIMCGHTGQSIATRISSGFELASPEFNDTISPEKDRVANDAVERSFSYDGQNQIILDDAVVAYKIDRSTGSAANGKICPPQRLFRQDALSQAEMITAETSELLLAESILPPPVADSGQLTSHTMKKCVSIDVFVGLVISLMISLGIMSFVIAFLMWKLHKRNNRTASVVRIEKRSCPF